MTAKDTAPKPTDAELAILRALWENGPSTVRQVVDRLNQSRPTGYTTALKLMQIMTDKGLLVRDERQRSHVYHPAFSKGQIQRGLVGDLIDRAFGASAHQLVMQALTTKEVSREEMAQIRRLLDEMEKEKSQ